MLIRERLPQYLYLMRLDKPIGIFLLLWPTLWALWLAGEGHPNSHILWIFLAGVILMRSAGCILNDLADRHVDCHVARTKHRPLAKGSIKPKRAFLLAAILGAVAFSLVLYCNKLTIIFAFIGAALAALYPLLKRVTHLPQLGLGVAFSWGIPMAFAAQNGEVGLKGWFLFGASIIWPVIYDTLYAMVDRVDDIQVGIKSTAILFNAMDKLIVGLLQVLFLVAMVIAGLMFGLSLSYFLCLFVVSCFFAYQQFLIRARSEHDCFKAFLNNNWVGLAIFIGIYLSYS